MEVKQIVLLHHSVQMCDLTEAQRESRALEELHPCRHFESFKDVWVYVVGVNIELIIFPYRKTHPEISGIYDQVNINVRVSSKRFHNLVSVVCHVKNMSYAHRYHFCKASRYFICRQPVDEDPASAFGIRRVIRSISVVGRAS